MMRNTGLTTVKIPKGDWYVSKKGSVFYGTGDPPPFIFTQQFPQIPGELDFSYGVTPLQLPLPLLQYPVFQQKYR